MLDGRWGWEADKSGAGCTSCRGPAMRGARQCGRPKRRAQRQTAGPCSSAIRHTGPRSKRSEPARPPDRAARSAAVSMASHAVPLPAPATYDTSSGRKPAICTLCMMLCAAPENRCARWVTGVLAVTRCDGGPADPMPAVARPRPARQVAQTRRGGLRIGAFQKHDRRAFAGDNATGTALIGMQRAPSPSFKTASAPSRHRPW